ncbi:5-formyltetrahydrofolate cyclo-ligase [Tenacibaculum maritimum]|uniref:5-formyltetrahydrofolate cyclo-ligase n=1 Tax=Tenacibaculum maritimum TaxID=107401 RepID=UPI001E2CF298|nr:5-formyltetrahydrofolate cyclo-ligase [Tenacibaculum maritimum]MCD9563072.1 5-formyltetrahydrofolate cyclo-ligase [Tenacibaculum maritimum]MCD9566596.1 5-formyltetrahydrofolate cyclo-ligase [Tenacibaculum maritimum]MCD9579879.1 5-formyltetrahydrofolate cyclo-ligase [Tenacibaculum maritimum]MCD9597258.1 5-formyltetrahydrofolate cyclo-ligase [Tenacibaculum maritimum]MCD9614516.1 5-formyltetrahydrofolate cyclo-ligase [Tenacibaculum maritimum]
MEKRELRKIYKEKRRVLTDSAIAAFEKNIYTQIQQMDWSSVSVIHIFLPIKQQKEINTYPIIDFLRSLKKSIVISKSDFKTNKLSHFLFDEDTSLVLNSYGIPEPVNAKEIAVSNIDLIFVPLLISDARKYRVGYGKGFYDRFIADCKREVITVGINFFQPIQKITDIHKYDMALSQVIYPI